MTRTVISACIIFLSACSTSNTTEETSSDSTVNDSTTAETAMDYSGLLPGYVYDRTTTYEGQFDTQLQTSAQEITDREGMIGLSQSIVMDRKYDIVVRAGEDLKLRLVMFQEHTPVLKLTNSRNLTFVNISFDARYEGQALVELSNCSNITFDGCTFMFGEEQSVAQTNSENIIFVNCMFGGPGSAEDVETDDDSGSEDFASEEENPGDESFESEEEEHQTPYPVNAWTSPVTSLDVPRKQENLDYFATNQYFNAVAAPGQMNYSSYSVLEFGRDFFTPVDWTQETETWKDGSFEEYDIPEDCEDRAKVLSLTSTRRKLWYIHRKLSFEQESGADANDRWRDDYWYHNRSYYALLFENRSSGMIQELWELAKPYILGEVTITRQQYQDALLFIDELLLYYSRVHATPFWEDRIYFLTTTELNLSAADYFYQAGFPMNTSLCMREGYTGGNYITGYDHGNEAWMYGFWLRRHQEGNMDLVKDILLWTKGEISKR